MGKIRLHYGLQRCNAQRAALVLWGRGVGNTCCRSSGCLLSFVGMPGTRRADALHYIRVGVGTKQRRHRNKVWKAL